MNSNKIICGTSFLLPKNEAWNILGPSNKIAFSEYGDWRGALTKCKKNQMLVFVIFVTDFLYNSPQSNKNSKKNFDLVKILLRNIEQHLKKTSSPTIITISSWKHESIIRQVSSKSNLEAMSNNIFSGLEKLRSLYSNFYILDLDKQLSPQGIKNAFDNRNWYLAHCRLSIAGLNILTKSLSAIINRITKPSKKVLVLDCDNTIWGGVVGEDGVSNIILGQDGLGSAFVDFQHAAKKIKQEGTLLALCSKNNEKDVWEVFKKHQSMVLKRNDIAAYKINWKEKYQNLKELSSELNLDLSSFVFWDDNPIERDKVKKMLPQVLTVAPSNNVIEWPDMLSGMDCFAKFNITKEDAKKTKQYQMRSKFTKDIKSDIDEISFLKSIKLKAKAVSMNESTIKRASQISMKTNQFNLRSIRYTEKEVLNLKKNTFLVNLKDIYGDHGLVGLVCTKKIDSKFVFLENFLMSCRVLGRHLESWMLNKILQDAKRSKFEFVIAEYIPTEKNGIAKNCLEDHGFKLIKNTQNKKLNKISLKKYVKNGKIYIASVKDTKIPFVKVYE